jgi:hypothetical protein
MGRPKRIHVRSKKMGRPKRIASKKMGRPKRIHVRSKKILGDPAKALLPLRVH